MTDTREAAPTPEEEMTEFIWTGDPEDEMHCRSVPGYLCHVEFLCDKDDPDDPSNFDIWYAGVSRLPHNPGTAYVFHSDEHDILPKTLAAAKRLCEMAVMADLWKKKS